MLTLASCCEPALQGEECTFDIFVWCVCMAHVVFLCVFCVCMQQVVDSGALDALVICLEEFDPGVKESSAWALGYIARHNAGEWIPGHRPSSSSLTSHQTYFSQGSDLVATL